MIRTEEQSRCYWFTLFFCLFVQGRAFSFYLSGGAGHGAHSVSFSFVHCFFLLFLLFLFFIVSFFFFLLFSVLLFISYEPVNCPGCGGEGFTLCPSIPFLFFALLPYLSLALMRANSAVMGIGIRLVHTKHNSYAYILRISFGRFLVSRITNCCGSRRSSNPVFSGDTEGVWCGREESFDLSAVLITLEGYVSSWT